MIRTKAMRFGLAGLAACLGVNAFAATAAISGAVTNGTTGQPSAGDTVLLMAMDRSRNEIARSRTDRSGRFRFAMGGVRTPVWVRVIHQGVVYNGPQASRIDKAVAVRVYDVARVLEGVTATQQIVRLQAGKDTLEVLEETVVHNASDPPRTLFKSRAFEVQAPPGAQVLAVRAQSGGERPLARGLLHRDGEGRYYMPFALRPGDARFAVAYRVPYSGEIDIEPRIVYPLQQFAVVLPKSMKFAAIATTRFQRMPGDARSEIQVASGIVAGQRVAFRVSGNGTLAPAEAVANHASAASASPAAAARATEARRQMLWYLAGGFLLVSATTIATLLARRRTRLRHSPA